MTVSYPIPFPSSILKPAKVTIIPQSVVAVAASQYTLQEQVQVHSGQRWKISIEYPTLSDAMSRALSAFVLRLNGRQGSFLLADPSRLIPAGTSTGTPLVNGAGQSGNYLRTDGWTPGTTGILAAGDYLQTGSGSTTRLYQVTADADSDSGGNASIEVWPALRQDASVPYDNAPIVTSGAMGVWRLAANENPWDVTPPIRGAYTLTAWEVL